MFTELLYSFLIIILFSLFFYFYNKEKKNSHLNEELQKIIPVNFLKKLKKKKKLKLIT